MSVSLKISLAGRVSISTDRVRIDERRLPGRQGRLVLAYLVSERGRPVLRDELADALWGETPPPTWEKALGGIASKLRALLGECGLDGAKALTSAFGCYRLELPEGTWVDVTAAAQEADSAEAALAAGRLDTAKAESSRAASIARLPLLPGEQGSWVEGQRRRLADVLVRALECLADACLRSGHASDAAKWADELITLEPFRESGHRRLMQAHAAAGNRAEALRAYEDCRRLLAEELGAYPSPETESIYRDLLLSSPAEGRVTTLRALAMASPVSAVVATPAAELPLPPSARAGTRLSPGRSASAEATSPRWPSRRIMAAAAFSVAAAAAFAVLVTRGSLSPTTRSVGANEVAVVDSESGKILSEIAADTMPGEVAAGSGALWVTNSGSNSVSRIDLSTNDVRQTIQVGAGPAGVAAGGGAVWVANGLEGTVSRIDPTANRVVQTITVGNGPSGVAYGEGSVWVTNSADGTVSQIDPGSGKVRRTLVAVIGASGVAVGFGRVWITSPPSGSVVALDPRSGRVLQRIGVGVDPDAVTTGGDAVWVANRADGTVSRFDPRVGAITETIRVGRGPDGIAAGPGAVWAANGADGTLSRIDPSSGQIVKTVRLDKPLRGVALSAQGLHVAVRSTGGEHRGGTLRVLAAAGVDSIDLALAAPNIWSVLTLTNDGLVGFRRVGGVQGTQLVPDLAVSLPAPTDGGKTYTFQVRPGVHYANGKLVQPDDFKRAIERLLEMAGPGGAANAYYYKGILGADHCAKGRPCDLSHGIVTDRGARTVTFHLTAPDADFLAKLALPSAFAVPAGVPAHDVGTQPIPATGPYRIAEYRKETKALRLVRNRGFREWSADAQPPGYPDSITLSWRFGLDTAAPVRAATRGAADVVLSGPPRSSPAAKQQLDVLSVRYPNQLHANTQLGTTFFFLNTRVPPFEDARVRRALNIAFDREVFAQQLGRAFAPTCRILPPNFPGYRPGCPYPPNAVTRLDAARLLVRSSGTAGARVTVWMPSPIAGQARYMVSVLEALGYRARVKAVDQYAYYGKVADSRVRAQIGYYTWSAGYPSAADFIPPQLSCAAFAPGSPELSSNLSQFCDRSVDAQMARAAAVQAQDPAAATVLWQRVEKSLLAHAPVVPAYNRRNVDFVSKRVGNYQYNPQWGLLLDQAWVK
jgi:YVTN family beta-propeller protein